MTVGHAAASPRAFFVAVALLAGAPALAAQAGPEEADARSAAAPQDLRSAPALQGARPLHVEPAPARVQESERLAREAADLRRRLAAVEGERSSLLEQARRLDQDLALKRAEAEGARARADFEAGEAARAAERAASLAARVAGLRKRAGLVARALHARGRSSSLTAWLLGGGSAEQIGSAVVQRQAALSLEAASAERAAREALADAQRRKAAAARLRAEAEAGAELVQRQANERQAALRRLGASARRDAEFAAEKERAAAALLAGLAPAALAERRRAAAGDASLGRGPLPSLPGLGAMRGRLRWPLAGRPQVLERWGPVKDPRRGTSTFRHGIALAAVPGEPIHAVAAGRVLFVDWYKGFGRCLVLDHGAGDLTVYGHADAFEVEAGDVVEAGMRIGRAGDTGSLDGPRLWFQIQSRGEAVDPSSWLLR